MAYVWRIEDDDGAGMYQYDGLIEAAEGELNDNADKSVHPNPIWDTQLGFNELPNWMDWYFGFATLSQMRQWVYKAKWRRKLRELGYLLVKYEVPDEGFRRSQYQAIFHKYSATIVERRAVDYADKRMKSIVSA